MLNHRPRMFLCAIAVCLPASILAQTQVVEASRPLSKAADLVEIRYGIAVSYEDAMYAYEGDVVDKTDPAYKSKHPEAKVLIPKPGRLEIALPKAPATQAVSLSTILQAIVDQHLSKGNAGQFKVIPIGQGYTIVPESVRNSAGVLIPDASPLDVRISFPEMERTAFDALSAICQAVSAASARRVVVPATPPGGLLVNQVVKLGASNETARDVLARLFANTHWADPRTVGLIHKYSWRLHYGPDVQMYALNVHEVMTEVSTPSGTKRVIPVNR
jgi:hypothetical protein